MTRTLVLIMQEGCQQMDEYTLTDSHAHIDSPQFADDRDAVLLRTTDAGVRTIVNVGYNAATWATTLALAEAHAGIFACLGLHPNDADTWDAAVLPALRRVQSHPKAVAVGETGLDYYRDHAAPALQQASFRAHLALARELGKPVVIHHRAAEDDLLAILREDAAAHGAIRGVLHAFNGGERLAGELLALGLHLGIGGPVTFKNAADLHAAVQIVPLERIVIETDSPYLPPHPHRGTRNEPARVALVAERIAALRGVSPAAIAAATTHNAYVLFGLPEREEIPKNR